MSEAPSAPSAAYNPKEIEQKWNEYWFSKKLFDLRIIPGSKVFSCALPPPNITGNLHMGHALNGTLQDVLTRWRRMQGWSVLWQPGTDHAGISTQMVVERQLKQQGTNRHQLGREKFLEKCWEWRHQYGNAIYNQYKRLGVSFAWDRQQFTMDPEYVKAIYRAFSILYKEGYIYRGKRVTNWCPRCNTSLSDLEVEHKETKGHLYLIRYQLADNKSEGLTVATTRPESIFGDVAVAVHPKDERYASFIGKNVLLPLANRPVPVIADDYVDIEFGTGALKITPAHDANDWEVGQRHKLEQPVVIDQHAKMVAGDLVPKQFHGLERFACRTAVVEELKQAELLVEQQDYVHGLGYCERCSTIIEPYLSDQWYVRMKDLAAPAIEVVENGKVTFVPARYASTYLDWMRNIRDWCISRQLWWGHRIPVWTCADCGHQDAFEDVPTACPKCQSPKFEQDADVLDTWFSSALWPFATLGWPGETDVMKTFYPTSILSTAREIINLWVARMIFTSLKFVGTVPFKEVLIHPVIQTPDGKRMSKSKGNAVDPLDMIGKFGCDANRFWFSSVGIKGDQDVRFQDRKLEEMQKFVNKIWNAGKFVMTKLEGTQVTDPDWSQMSLADRWIVTRYNRLLESVDRDLTNYDFDNASRSIYDFTWDYFCDWYLEIAKMQIGSEVDGRVGQTRNVLWYVFEGLLRVLHPFMPYITEELWHQMPRRQQSKNLESIMFAEFPKLNDKHIDQDADSSMEFLMRVIRSVRNMRHTYNVAPGKKAEIVIDTSDPSELKVIETGADYIRCTANVSNIQSGARPSGMTAKDKISASTIFMPLAELIDVEKSVVKLEERQASVTKKLTEKKSLLERDGFREKAPPEKVAQLEEELKETEHQLALIQEQIKTLRGE